MADESEFLCGDWVWDASIRELRHYPRRKKGHAEEPDAVERLEPARRIRLHRWSQQPVQTATGDVMPGSLARVVVEYLDGRTLDINEEHRDCARTLADTIAAAYGTAVVEEGAPAGRRGGNLPGRDGMGRLVNKESKVEVVLDEVAGEISVTRSKRLLGKERRTLRTNEVRRVELTYVVNGPMETFAVWALAGPEEERLPLASYTGFEGWGDPEEWRAFTEELGRSLGVESVLPARTSDAA